MIQTVVKRDGRVVGFNEQKIMGAIRKAMMHTDKGARQIKKALADQPRLEKVMTVQSAAKGVQK